MKITAFNGSQWGGKSNTQFMVDEFLSGACDCGARVESISLVDRVVKPCTGCFDCFGDKHGRCPIKDDMPALIKKFVNSKIAVLATPVYMDGVTGLMKTFIDRLLPVLQPYFEQDENGEFRHGTRHLTMPTFVIIANAHMPEDSHFQVVKLFMHRLARSFHTKIVAEIYRGTGGLLRSQEEHFKPYIRYYKQLLRDAGQELVLTGHISFHTQQELNKPLVPTDEYIDYANRMWDKLLETSEPTGFARIQNMLQTLWT